MTRLSLSLLLLTGLSACTAPDDSGGKDSDTSAPDADGDGSPDDEDCADDDATTYPGAEEACDGVDNDCDGTADLGDATGWFPDGDGDGWGDADGGLTTCTPEAGWIQTGGDCDDTSASVHPEAAEVCNGADDDCDQAVDEDFDTDHDGHVAVSCAGGDDCDDADEAIHPGATEVCGDEVDDDCDGADAVCGVDEGLGEAEVKVTSPFANFESGRLLDGGDLDGDGKGDVLASTLAADTTAGGAWITPGPLVSGDFDALGHRLVGITSGDGAGRSIAVGDVDDDGIDDAGIGVPFAPDCAERIVLGPVVGDVDLAAADVVLFTSSGGFCGHGADLADVDGDSVADAVVGAYGAATGGQESGSVYVKYGPLAPGSVDLDADADAVLVGEEAFAWTGRVVRVAEDLDGDGLGDILAAAVGASLGGPSAGAVYVVQGDRVADLDMADADGRLVGEAPYDYAGVALASGDVDGDGRSDVILGAQASEPESVAGAAYVVYGPAEGDIALADADVIVRGEARNQLAGGGVGAGDLDGDGRDELVVGAPGDGTVGDDAGAAYVYSGVGSGVWSVGDAGWRVYGEAPGDEAGWGVAILDTDADGLGELLVGAPKEETGGAAAGALYALRPAP